MKLIEFGRFRFSPDTGELWRNGSAVHLAPKPGKVLALLVGSPGRLVARSKIEAEVWGGQPIDLERSVNFAIRQVRTALGDAADAPVYIETLPRRGYRFIAPVREVTAPVTRPTVEGALPEGAAHPGPERSVDLPGWLAPSRRKVAGGALLVALVGAFGVAGGRIPGTTASAGDGLGDGATLAILPLDRLGDDATHDYFVSGLTDEVITRMARLDPERLTVIAPVSAGRAAGAGGSDAEIAELLSADYLLRGSITPTGEAVRVGVRLLDASDGSVLWADRYVEPIPTSPALEYEIALRVGEALRRELPLEGSAPDPAFPVAGEARAAYLQGSYLLDRGGYGRLNDALELLERAVDQASAYAPAHTALGRALVRMGRRSEAWSHLNEAVRLDPSAAEPRVALGMDALYAQWDLDVARRHFEEALARDPGNVLSHHPFAYFLSIAGRHQEAISRIETALRLDPVSPLVNGDVGRIYYRAGRFDDAKEQCLHTLTLAPTHAAALSCLINIHVLQGDPAGALPFAIRSLGAGDDAKETKGRLMALPPSEAMSSFFEGRLAELEAALEDGVPTHVQIAQTLIFLGRTEEALDALEAALAAGSTVLPQVPGDPCFAVLAGHPRFEAIVKAMGIPV